MIRIAATADVHCRCHSDVRFGCSFSGVNEEADLLVIAGDLTGVGQPEEAHLLVRELSEVKVPIVVVLGNHDHHSERQDAVSGILTDGGITVLNGGSYTLELNGSSLGITGAKGFGGGFGARQLTAFGEAGIKDFLAHAEAETEKIRTGLASMTTDIKLVLLHYSPISATLKGEPLEIYPFLGCSMFCLPIDEYRADLVLHGHAHKGVERGETPGGVPVRNVALQVTRRQYVLYDLVPSGSGR